MNTVYLKWACMCQGKPPTLWREEIFLSAHLSIKIRQMLCRGSMTPAQEVGQTLKCLTFLALQWMCLLPTHPPQRQHGPVCPIWHLLLLLSTCCFCGKSSVLQGCHVLAETCTWLTAWFMRNFGLQCSRQPQSIGNFPRAREKIRPKPTAVLWEL